MVSNPPILATERLYLNRMVPEDAAEVFALNDDPEVIRYAGDPPFESIEAARQFLEQYKGYEEPGFGRFAMRLLSDHSFLGWCGLKRTEEMSEVDLGYRLHQKHWNRGYATEAAHICLEHGFHTLGLSRIIGRVMHANMPSIRVLEKVGMTYWKEIVCEAHPARCYKLEQHEYKGIHV